jgi:hypothetical protein
MKKNRIIIVVLLILIPVVYFQHERIERMIGLTESLDFRDLVKRDGLYYKKSTEVPFTGKVTGKKQGSFKNGKKDGLWVRYHSNGQLWGKGTYMNGKRDGSWVWFMKDGTVDPKHTGTYKNGVKVK